MTTNQTDNYDPAEDDNQGVVQLMAQGEKANSGVSQAKYMNPVTAQGPEPEKAEVNEFDSEDATNDDELAEEDVENGQLDEESE
ncbi:hypothetical protein [Spirosoma sp. KNUC1025]|uniref:hypothetical protein n=1 Tax=Spirosoma sp. KNUC1025 TaxID=2894082 RepID=UPI00386CC001|nr:hypothetical protein LN737_26165 [Spirosoma sp. KNUC1025]